MKYFAFILVVAFGLLACSSGTDGIGVEDINNPATASGQIDTTMLPRMEFEDVRFDFGNITQGERVTTYYKFTNTGKSDLIVTSAKGSCGCTVPSWPKEPIAPGGSGSIKVVFDSSGKKGRQSKLVTIVANTHPSTNKVTIVGEVIAPDN